MATFHKKVKLFRGLFSGEFAYTGPFYAGIDLTNNCNLRCVGCPFHSPISGTSFYHNPAPGNIDCEFFERTCRELKDAGTQVLVLQGSGEPFLHPELSSIISIGKAYGFHLTLLTNGTLFDRGTLQNLMDLKLDVLKITLWATSVKEFEQNYPGTDPVTFFKILDGLKLLRSLKDECRSSFPLFLIHYPINRVNYQSVETVTDLAISLGTEGITFAPFHYGSGQDWNSYVLSPDEENLTSQALKRVRRTLNSKRLVHNIDDTLVCYRFKTSVWKEMPCYMPWFHVRLHIDGMIYLCARCSVRLGNLKKESFQDIWNGRVIRHLRKRFLRNEGFSENPQCPYCFFASDTWRIHQKFRWFLPLATKKLLTNTGYF